MKFERRFTVFEENWALRWVKGSIESYVSGRTPLELCIYCVKAKSVENLWCGYS